MKIKKRQKGFVGIIVIIVVALVALKYYFKVDLDTILNNPIVGEIWSIIKQVFSLIWKLITIILDFLQFIVSKIKGLFSK